MNTDFFENYFYLVNKYINAIKKEQLIATSEIIKNAAKNGNKVILIGNGGSAAMASHVSVDLTKVAGIRAVNFNESDLITCFANDFGYENIFKKALEFYADKNDVLILVSSSGKSPNMIHAAKYGKEMGLKMITLSGFSETNPLKSYGDINLWVDSNAYNIIEMTHHIWLLSIADYIVGDINYSA